MLSLSLNIKYGHFGRKTDLYFLVVGIGSWRIFQEESSTSCQGDPCFCRTGYGKSTFYSYT